tara:strand:- start:2901 stop:3158 length:258 start_codon:yes stop_codon:yes gene_type:complete
MRNKPLTTAYVTIECQNLSEQSIQGNVCAGNFQWNFSWEFGRGELIINPPLGRALIKDSLEKFLIQDDYKLELGENYIFTVRAKF